MSLWNTLAVQAGARRGVATHFPLTCVKSKTVGESGRMRSLPARSGSHGFTERRENGATVH